MLAAEKRKKEERGNEQHAKSYMYCSTPCPEPSSHQGVSVPVQTNSSSSGDSKESAGSLKAVAHRINSPSVPAQYTAAIERESTPARHVQDSQDPQELLHKDRVMGQSSVGGFLALQRLKHGHLHSKGTGFEVAHEGQR